MHRRWGPLRRWKKFARRNPGGVGVWKSNAMMSRRAANFRKTEIKYTPTVLNNTITNTVALYDLQNIATGATRNTRIGNKTTPTHLRMHGVILPNESSTAGGCEPFTLMLVRSLQGSRTASDYVTFSSGVGYANQDQCQVLWQYTGIVAPYLSSHNTAVKGVQINKKFKLKRKQTTFTSGSAGTATVGGIFLIVFGIDSSYGPTMIMDTTLFFTDD
jgi:hypothetical protein